MKTYQIKWVLHSAISTELESDTIFGHFCWNYLYLKGEDALVLFLNRLKNNECTFTLSNGFVDQCVPIPKLPLSKANIKTIEQNCSFKYDEQRKELKKLKSLSLDLLKQYSKNFSLVNLYKDHYNHKIDLVIFNLMKTSKIAITHNSINRLTGTTSADMDNLYQENTQFYPKNAEFYSWLKTDCFELEELQNVFNQISFNGFGKDKHTGKGYFSIDVQLADSSLFQHESPNAWMLLSNSIPHEDDPQNVYYNSKVKFAKLGGFMALNESPFKYPLLVFTPGTIFLSNKAPIGSILDNIHPFKPNIVQNLSAFVMPLHIEGVSYDS